MKIESGGKKEYMFFLVKDNFNNNIFDCLGVRNMDDVKQQFENHKSMENERIQKMLEEQKDNILFLVEQEMQRLSGEAQ